MNIEYIADSIDNMLRSIAEYYEVSDREGKRVDYEKNKAEEAVNHGFDKGMRLADVVQLFDDTYTVVLRFEKRDDEQ